MRHDRQPEWSRRRVLALAGAAALVPPTTHQAATEIAAIMRRFRAAYQSVDTRALEALLAADISFSDPTFALRASGVAEMRAIITESAALIAAVVIDVEHELIAEPRAIVRQRQTLELQEPAGGRISVRNVSLFRIADGLITEWHDYADALGFQRQMAAIRGKKG